MNSGEREAQKQQERDLAEVYAKSWHGQLVEAVTGVREAASVVGRQLAETPPMPLLRRLAERAADGTAAAFRWIEGAFRRRR